MLMFTAGTSAWFSKSQNHHGAFKHMIGECVLTSGHFYITKKCFSSKEIRDTAIKLDKPLSENERMAYILKYGFPCLPPHIVETYYLSQ